MEQNPLQELVSLGQSIWIDFIRRSTTSSGELKRLIEQDGVSGVTSNPSIFEKAIAGSTDYDAVMHTLIQEGKSTLEIYEALAISDIRQAADILRPLYESSHGQDGYVSLEVNPRLAHDTSSTTAEVQQLHDSGRRLYPVVYAKIGAPACAKRGI